MIKLSKDQSALSGPAGSILVPPSDEITLKLAMLYEGECEGTGPTRAARKFGYTKQRYFQLLHGYRQEGAAALQSKPRGPKHPYRRTDELVRQVIRHRFVDPDASVQVIAQKLKQARWAISLRGVERIVADYGLQKKLYALGPNLPPRFLPTQRTRCQVRSERADPLSLERAVRQFLADRISGNQVGLWLLLPEHLRLGTWELLCRWSGGAAEAVEPRLALHLIHEAALCLRDLRHHRSLAQKGFEVANGLPFVPTDQALHDLLEGRSVADSEALQVALGKLRRVNHHFQGRLLVIDPHRLRSFSQRHMRRRRSSTDQRPEKVG